MNQCDHRQHSWSILGKAGNHILLQVDHKGNKIVIRISQIMLVIAIIWQFAEMVAQIFDGVNTMISSTASVC